MSWKVDPNHSQIGFSAKHMGIFTVRGQFKAFEIDFEFDENDPENTYLEARVDAASVDTGNKQRDDHLRSADFLNAEEHPEIVFRSTSVQQLNANNGKLYGEMTIQGKTKKVALDVVRGETATSPWGQTATGFAASTKIKRSEWGLTWNQALEAGGVLVSDEIELAIELEAIQESELVPA